MERNHIKITLAGQEYCLVADETQEYMDKIAGIAQQSIDECYGAGITVVQALALSSLRMADKLLRAGNALVEAQKENEKLTQRLDALCRNQIEQGDRAKQGRPSSAQPEHKPQQDKGQNKSQQARPDDSQLTMDALSGKDKK